MGLHTKTVTKKVSVKKNGFTLVEVVLVLALASLMMASLSSSFIQSVFIQKKLAGKMTALILGEQKIAELEHGSEPTNSGGFPKPYTDYTWVAQEETADDGTKIIYLTVKWREFNVARSITLQGYRTEE